MLTHFWWVRFAILRLLGLVYLVAFAVAIRQNRALIGSNGLTPMRLFLRQVRDEPHPFWNTPTLFWLDDSDRALAVVAWSGAAVSLAVLLGAANALMMALLWVLYQSLVQVGQVWYRFGWESLLLETGFLAIFLCPLLAVRPFPATAPPVEIIWLFRWLGFRVMLGAGLIKLRGDECWKKLTCLDYHFETQPVPGPFSRFLHFLPRPFLRAGVAWNHLVELVAPWFYFGPDGVREVAGTISIGFQVFLILSGNLSFLNWLTIVPFMACFDDVRIGLPPTPGQVLVARGVTALIALLSIRPMLNLLARSQIMMTSFDPFRLVNTYGAFGAVGKVREEVVLEGTDDVVLTPATEWKPYEFKVKPGAVERRPPFVSPYHWRLDWLMWFVPLLRTERTPWLFHLVWKLLHGDPETLGLLAGNPFPDAPPRFIRAELYEYRFHRAQAPIWERTRLRPWLPPMAADQQVLRDILREFRWIS